MTPRSYFKLVRENINEQIAQYYSSPMRQEGIPADGVKQESPKKSEDLKHHVPNDESRSRGGDYESNGWWLVQVSDCCLCCYRV